jgi:tetrahydromethanopterin S-methyltransferase subunit G
MFPKSSWECPGNDKVYIFIHFLLLKMWFSKKENRMSMVLKASFDHVKQNFDHVFGWIGQINQKQADQDGKIDYIGKRIENIELYLAQIPNLNAQIRNIVDLHYSYESIIKRLSSIEEKMRYITSSNQQIPQEQFLEIKNKLESLEKRKEDLKSNLKEKMLKNITRNSKEYIKSTIFSLIRKYERVSAFKLKEIIVEEQALCSKSTFYRILEEIEKKDEIEVVWEGKEKVFLLRLASASSSIE